MKQLSILTLFLALCWSCTCDHDDTSSPEKSGFSVADARKYFEQSSTQVADLTFSAATRSARSTLTPDWESARITGTGDITTIETPLSDGELQEFTIRRITQSGVSAVRMKAVKRLVVQRKTNGDTRQFVVSMLYAGQTRSAQDDNCYGKSDYSGFILVSSVDGEYLDAFESEGGVWTRQRATTQEQEDGTLNLARYSIDDDGPAPAGFFECPHCLHNLPMGAEYCGGCNTTIETNCIQCGPLAVCVCAGRVCPTCIYPIDKCVCCKLCRRYPCECPWGNCIKCGSRLCNGNCRPDIDGSGGGGGGSSGPGTPNNCVNSDNEKVLKILDKLNEDCMGKTLFSKLQDRKIPVKIVAGTGAQYIGQVESGNVVEAIYLGSDSPDVAFLEELIHVYQLTKATPGNYFQLNTEIEAKLGWAMYVQRKGENVSDYKKYLGLDYGVVAFERLCKMQTSGISLYKEENLSIYRDTYYDIVNIFRTLDSAYKNPDKYPFSKDHMYFKNLGELMADC